ncbi:hypothetical protein PVNG_05244 [Plasmodium vivax North Korean]|uniref:VIR protein n=1 Tax=Plasmodium vivax North Korean TaxID=1035514 RepID=A0A0J9TUG6_PLAVI|nr:hypothetical protein PVNG_05244 [Plasmodium vivax North Korean]
MDTSRSKCKSLDDNLPSSEFDKQFRQSINLDTLENAALYKENKVNIENWLQNFTTQFSHYYNKESVKWHKNIHGKRCRDLNYYVDYIIDLISELEFKGNRGKRVKASKTEIDTVKQSMKSLFKHSDKFKCDREEEDYVKRIPIKKDLDDFCENRDYLYGYLDNSNKDCDRLTTYVKEKYDFFFNENTCILDPNNGNEKPLKINDNCTLYDIPKTFSYGHCSNDEMPHRIKSIPHCPAAETFTFGKFLQYISDYMQYIPGISFIQDNLLYVGIGVGGALTLFFVIYKV